KEEPRTGVMIPVAIGLLAFASFYIGVPWLHGRVARVLLRRAAAKRRAIVLTFDDGPGNRLTLALLSLFAENDARATFFPLGRNIAGRERLVKEILERGHEICSHGYDHLHQWKVLPFRALSDIRRGWKAIDKVLGTEGGRYPFRPPNGKLNILCLFYLLLLRVPIVYWSEDSGDTWPTTPTDDRLALLAKKTGGLVSLAHDFDRSTDERDQFVIESTGTALVMAKEQNMSVLTVSQLLNGTGR
ncbi:MAG: polysaccharide deacetylase family protein, partial [Planctomycetota bacterium]